MVQFRHHYIFIQGVKMPSASVFIQQNIKESLGNDSKLYVTPDIPEKKLNNAAKAYNVDYKTIISLYDSTIFGGGDEGFILTGKSVVFKPSSDAKSFEYTTLESIKCIDKIDKDGKNKGVEKLQITTNDKNIHTISNTYGNIYPLLVKFLMDIINNKELEFKDENTLNPIEDMSESLKSAYLKIIITMSYSDDKEIDSKELAEIFLLMSRLKLDHSTRFEIREYITNISDENIADIKSCIETIKQESDPIHHKPLMISLAKDLINTHFSTKEQTRDFPFLEQNKIVFGLTDEEIDLAYQAVENDYKLLNEEIDDDTMKKTMKDIAAKATGIGVPLGAVYISGSVVGMSAAGMTSGLASLGMGGILGFSSMATGIGVAVLLGIGAYQGVKFLTGSNAVSKYAYRADMLRTILKENQKVISQIIDDLNYIVQKLNSLIKEHNAQKEKIEALVEKVDQFQGALNAINNKTREVKNMENRLSCPKTLSVSRLKDLTKEATKQSSYDYIMQNYEEKTIQQDGKDINAYCLKENIDNEVLEKMVEIFKAIEYFKGLNIVKDVAKDKKDKVTSFFNK